MWPFTTRTETIEDKIKSIPIRSLRENFETIETSLKIIRATKHKIGWGNSLASNPIAIELMEKEHLGEFASLGDLILKTRTMIVVLITKAKKNSNIYKLSSDLETYLNTASASLGRDLEIIKTRISDIRAA